MADPNGLPTLRTAPTLAQPQNIAGGGQVDPRILAGMNRRNTAIQPVATGPNGQVIPTEFQEPTIIGPDGKVQGVGDQASKDRSKQPTIDRGSLPAGTLVATNTAWFYSLSEASQKVVYDHNSGVYQLYRDQGGIPSSPPMKVNVGSSEVPAWVDWDPQKNGPGFAATGSRQSTIAGKTGNDAQTITDVYDNPRSAGPSVGASNGSPANTNPTGSGFGLGAESGNLTAAEKATISSSTDAMLSYLLRQDGRDTQTQRSRYQEAMSAMPALYLIENFADIPVNPNEFSQDGSSTLFSQIFQNALSSDSAFDYGRQFLASQDAGGVDPNKALNALFSAGMIPDGNAMASENIVQMMGGMGQAEDQINFVKNAVGSSLINANPMMTNIIMTLLDVLGTRYVSEGGSAGGFMDWLTKNSMFSEFAGGTNGVQ